MGKRNLLTSAIDKAQNILIVRLQPHNETPDQSLTTGRIRLAVICASVFLAALGVRLLHLQDARLAFKQPEAMMNALMRPYRQEAKRMLEEGGVLFPNAETDPGNARLVVHPPGYSMLIAAFYSDNENDPSYSGLRLLQIACDSLSCVLVVLIVAQLLAQPVAAIAGAFCALSPHFAYYSLWLSPDTLSVLPILMGVYLTVLTVRRPRLTFTIAAGVLFGLSCWLRANALLLAPFMTLPFFFYSSRRNWIKHSCALVAAGVLVIAPITIRNWVVHHRFVPLTVVAGLSLIEGIADYDPQGVFGMPQTDREASVKDVEWNNQPDYGGSLWFPDGVDRDRARFTRGLDVIKSNPRWFLNVMFRRAAFMLRYNDRTNSPWPMYTAVVPIVDSDPPFGSSPALTGEREPDWRDSAAKLFASGKPISSKAQISIAGGDDDALLLRVVGDDSEFGDQFASEILQLRPNSDYVLVLFSKLDRGHMAIKVTNPDRRITLGSADLIEEQKRPRRKSEVSQSDPAAMTSGERTPLEAVQAPFATGEKNMVRFVISNNGADPSPAINVERAELFYIGETPQAWTRYPRYLVRIFQKNIFTTGRMIPLVLIGIGLLILYGRSRALMLLISVPVYYLLTQSVLHTEYRYILAIHYFLFGVSATALYFIGAATGGCAGRAYYAVTKRKVHQSTSGITSG